MRYLMILVYAFSGIIFTNCEQKTELLPTEVIKAFEQKVPNASDVEWEYDREDKLWEAEYKVEKDEFTSAFDDTGKWIETEYEIGISELPEPIKATLKADYVDYKVEETALVNRPDGKFYEVGVESENDKNEVELELLFSPDGKLVKEEEEKGDEEGDDR